MRQFLLCGYYGKLNTGDDALIAVTAKCLINEFDTDLRMLVTSSIDYRANGAIVKACIPKKKLFFGHQRLFLWYAAFKSNSIVFGGGSNFHSLKQLNEFEALLKLSGKGPHYALGISIGPFTNDASKKKCAEILKRFHFIGVRDSISFDRAKDISPTCNVHKTFDLAVLLDSPKPTKRSHENAIGIVLCNYEKLINGDTESEKRATEIIVESILEYNYNGKIILIDFNGDPNIGDSSLHAKIRSQLEQKYAVKHILYQKDPTVVLEIVSNLECIIAMRLHAAIFGYIAEIPVISIEYHEKCKQWNNEIAAAKELCIDRNTLNKEDMLNALRIALNDEDHSLPVFSLENARQCSLKNWEWLF